MTSDKAAELRIERIQLATIKPHPKNPRAHPDPGSQEWEILKRSLDRDYFDPLVVNRKNGMLVSGHLRHKVLLASGYTHADVSVVEYDEPTHLARLVAANNQFGEFVEELLSALAKDIEASGLDAALAGWDEKAMAALLEGPSVSDDTTRTVELVSKADALQEKWQIQLDDLFQVGGHRLLCGDCKIRSNWERLLAGRKADMVWTDPPYNVDYESLQQHRIELKTEGGQHVHNAPEEILNDDLSDEDYHALLLASLGHAYEFTKPGGVVYVAHADSHGLLVRQAVAAAGWKLAQNLIWVKNAWTLGRQDYQWQHEPILYGWKPGAAHYWQGGFSLGSVIDDEEVNLKKASKEELIDIIGRLRNARETSVIREARSASTGLHPTVKPLPLVARQIWNSSRRGELVIEPFGGSGTTLAACQETGRVAVATELEPKFCAVILERLSALGLEVRKIDGRDIC